MSLEKTGVIIKRILTSKRWRIRYVLATPFGKLLPDSIYLKSWYWAVMGKKLDLKNPQTFNEKLQWLKLHDRKQIYTTMVDKYLVKEYVARIIGEEHIIPTLGVFNNFDEINFDELPNQFVLKCTHNSGGIAICKNKTTFNLVEAKHKLEHGLKENFFYCGREWPYKNVKPRIIVEKYMSENEGLHKENNNLLKIEGLKDYKFYCFNGKPEFLYLSQGLDNHDNARISYLDLEWNRTKYRRLDYREFEILPEKPENLKTMIKYAQILSSEIPFLRVDLYSINSKIYLSELTFYPGGGFTPFHLDEHDLKIGKRLNIKCKETNKFNFYK